MPDSFFVGTSCDFIAFFIVFCFIFYYISIERWENMILSDSSSTYDLSRLESIPECKEDFPIACYGYSLHFRQEPWHWHHVFELGYILDGKAILKIENQEFVVSKGEAYFVNSDSLHSLYPYDKDPCSIKSIIFGKTLVGGEKDSLFWKKYILPLETDGNLCGFILHPEIPWQKKTIEYINLIYNYMEFENEDYEIETRNVVTRILSLFIHHLDPHGNCFISSDEYTSRIKTMLVYILKHYSEPITLSDIASSCNISNNECLSCFKKVINISPIQYLKNYRLQKASELLSKGQMSIREISEQCGFQDHSYFAKSFKQQFHMTPLQYRHLNKGREI